MIRINQQTVHVKSIPVPCPSDPEDVQLVIEIWTPQTPSIRMPLSCKQEQLKKLIPAEALADRKPSAEPNLSQREWELVPLILRGDTYRTIAHKQNISVNTVKSHIRSIYRKYGCRNRTQLILQLQNPCP